MRIYPIVTLMILMPALAWAQKPENGKGGPPKATPVIVAPVTRETFVDKGEALGTLKAQESIVVTSQVSETVTAINFTDGQRVEAGQVLVEMTSAEEAAQLQEERATVNEASRQVERLKPLVAQGAASKSLIDQRRREAETAQARLKAIESRLEDRLIRAPFSGVVGLRNISVGAYVQSGTQITTLDDDSVMKLDFTVPSNYLADLRVGLPVVARARAFGDREFKGEVSAIESQIDPVTRSVTVRAMIPNPEAILKPGLLMSVDILKNERQTLVVPEEALIPEGKQNFVFVVDSAAAAPVVEKKKVEIGARRPGDVEILSGIEEGQQVITHGNFMLRPGATVSITAQETGDETLPELLNQKSSAAGKPDDAATDKQSKKAD
jgi:membrane fusion protein (multidrug efflux system)